MGWTRASWPIGLSLCPFALTCAPTLYCFSPCSLLWKSLILTCCLPACCVPISHQCSHSKKKPHQTALESGVQIPTWLKEPTDSGAITGSLWGAPAPGSGWQVKDTAWSMLLGSATCFFGADMLAWVMGTVSCWCRGWKGPHLLHGSNRKLKEEIDGGNHS